MAARSYNVAILGSIGVNPGYVLVNNKDYPEIADDYVRSFKALRSLPVDVFLGAHGSFYGLTEKYARLEKGGPNPFIDPDGFKAHLDRQEKNFKARLDEQKKAASEMMTRRTFGKAIGAIAAVAARRSACVPSRALAPPPVVRLTNLCDLSAVDLAARTEEA